MTVKPCLTCGKPTRAGSRCPPCQVKWQRDYDRRRGTSAQRGYGAAWRKKARETVQASPMCAVCGTPRN